MRLCEALFQGLTLIHPMGYGLSPMLTEVDLQLVKQESSLPLWQRELAGAVRSLAQLDPAHWAFLRSPEFQRMGEVAEKYRVLVPQSYLALVDPHDPQDPIARMAFPGVAELNEKGRRDPIGDLAKQAAPRLTHRYGDRVLLHTTNLCPMYCRFCFRKNLMNEGEEELYGGDFEEALAYIQSQPQVKEVILTGGDPWMLSDRKLGALVERISDLPNVEKIRFHTRMLVTLPSRVTDGLLEILGVAQRNEKRVYVVTHFNHPRELSEDRVMGVQRILALGVRVLNQAVLLKGVNNSASLLRGLFAGLEKIGVQPYYLHHGDSVAGASHFRTTVEESLALFRQLRGTLPGYALPQLVLDLPGGYGKVPLAELVKVGEGRYRHEKSEEDYLDP